MKKTPYAATSCQAASPRWAKNFKPFATAGSGNGGYIWALAQEPEQITELTEQWQKALADVPTAQILDVAIDPQGLKVEQINP